MFFTRGGDEDGMQARLQRLNLRYDKEDGSEEKEIESGSKVYYNHTRDGEDPSGVCKPWSRKEKG